MEEKTCQYEGCNEPVCGFGDGKLCIFHSPKDSSHHVIYDFNSSIFEKIRNRDYNFRGYIFPGGMIFKEGGDPEGKPMVFEGDVDFSYAKFEGRIRTKIDLGFPLDVCVDFAQVEFKGNANFREASFLGGEAYFGRTVFSGGKADFQLAKFDGGHANFRYSIFSKGEAKFYRTIFKGGSSIFWEADFSGGGADFRYARFLGGNADFSGAKITGGAVSFTKARFKYDIIFVSNTIKYSIYFTDIKIDEKSIFYFQDPKFIILDNSKNMDQICLLFERVHFNAFCAYFERIGFDELDNHRLNPIFIYRYCQLKDVYFTKNNMSLFSFYKSSFDEALFLSSTWNFLTENILLFLKYRRWNIIPEERMLTELRKIKDDHMKRKEYRSRFKIDDLLDYYDMAALYRNMKTALDRSKDYARSGWFYFNEYEMKRRELKDELLRKNIFRRIFSRLSLYNMYKLFAGFGEKPLWSFWWFSIFTFVFAILHLLSGLDPIGGKITPPTIHFGKYLSFSQCISTEFLKDLATAFMFSASRAIPVNYLGVSPSGYWDSGIYGQVITFFNSLILFILVIFVAIGLKRHFRRF